MKIDSTIGRAAITDVVKVTRNFENKSPGTADLLGTGPSAAN